MTPPNLQGSGRARVAVLGLALAAAVAAAGCFDAPKVEDRWTRVDLTGANVTPYQPLTLGTSDSFHVGVDVTYRAIVTGYAIAELRVSPTLAPGALHVDPEQPRLLMAQDIDTLLAHSVSAGRATRAITGWDHLIQHIDFDFRGTVPGVVDSTGAGGGGVYLLCYLGAGERVRRLGEPETLVVTPFRSGDAKVLPIGMAFRTAGTP